jgi:hypothetical protein
MMPTSSPIPDSGANMPSVLPEEMIVLHLIATGIVRRATNIEHGQRANGNYEVPLQLGLDRLNVLRYRQALALIKSVPDLLAHCQEPIGEWLPGDLTIFDPDEQLLGGPFPTEICQNLACLTGDVEADLTESRFIERVFNACKEASSPQAYTDFRRLLITRPVMTALELLLCCNVYPSLTILRELLHEAYEPAPLDYMVGGVFACCPTCQNLQIPNYEQTRFACESERCRRYAAKAGEGRRISASDQIHWLKRGLRRFVAQPGLPELRLEKSLRTMGVAVEMWPEFDSYDLLVRLPEKTIAVDVKDWANPFLLARKVQEKCIPSVPGWDEAYYIFPEERKRDQPDYVRGFTNTCNTFNGKVKIGGKVKAAFENDFVSMVRSKVKGRK